MDYPKRLAREWYEYQGYFVRRAVRVGLTTDGRHPCELSLVAFHPLLRHVVQIEPYASREPSELHDAYFRTKFDAGKTYLHRLFGTSPPLHVEQIALVDCRLSPSQETIGGGRVVRLEDLISQILKAIAPLEAGGEPVREQWPLIRTLQLISLLDPLPIIERLNRSAETSPTPQYDPRSADDS